MKTKKQLLAVMDSMCACSDAERWVRNHRSRSALKIGMKCPRPEWMIWLLWRRLTPEGRQLFADRLGLVRSATGVGSETYDEWDIATGYRPGVAYRAYPASKLDRRVINDCWRAWCRSKS